MVGVLATDENLTRAATAPGLFPEPAEQVSAWPNPFANSATIDFSLSQPDRYSVTLYDTKGSRIRVIGQGWANAGVHNTIRIDGTHLASGLYLVKIQTGWYSQTLKVIKR
jgi:hypothetical protein